MENNMRYGKRESVFTGSMLGLLGVDLATGVLTALSLGIAYPWLLCWKERWLKEHTYINGRQLAFDGTGAQLIGNWIKWSLLTLITFGIYGLWVPIRLEQWTVKHTSFSDEIRSFVPTQEESTSFGKTLRQGANWLMAAIRRGCQILSRWLAKIGGQEPQSVPRPQQESSHRKPQPSENHCPNCGTVVAPGAKFCGCCAYPMNRTW